MPRPTACGSRSGARDGPRVPGVAAIVANVPRPTAAGPARLAHDDVATLFHEFGHVLHEILGTSAHYGTAMPQVEEDFVEAVSQIMENWAWEPAILERIGRHVETGERCRRRSPGGWRRAAT